LKRILKAVSVVTTGFPKAGNSTVIWYPKTAAKSIFKKLAKMSTSKALWNPFMRQLGVFRKPFMAALAAFSKISRNCQVFS
jgi:hypothetical protein